MDPCFGEASLSEGDYIFRYLLDQGSGTDRQASVRSVSRSNGSRGLYSGKGALSGRRTDGIGLLRWRGGDRNPSVTGKFFYFVISFFSVIMLHLKNRLSGGYGQRFSDKVFALRRGSD